MRITRFAALLMTLLLCCGSCATTAGVAPSAEFRLRNLEAKYLELEQKQQDLEQRLLARMAPLEGQYPAQSPQAPFRDTLPPPAPALPEPARPAQKQPELKQPAPPVKQAAPPPAKATAPRPKPAPAAQVTMPKPAAAPPSDSAATGQPLYDDAVQFVQQGKAAQARELLQRFIRENPSSALLPNAIYWLGETWYHEKEYGQAILSFKDVAGRFPKHDKAPAAMLKIGYCYENLEDHNNARFYLQALVDEYPDSEPARTARTKLQNQGG